MRQGALNVTAKINAKAAGGVSEVSNALPKPAATCPPEPTVAENSVPAPRYKEPKTPKAASLLTIDAK